MNALKLIVIPVALSLALPLSGCAREDKQDRDFHTSGSREADQRAEQQVAKVEQLRGEGEGDDKKGGDDQNTQKTLFDRLGGEQGIQAIVEDYVPRVLADPRVNWERKGVASGGFMDIVGRESQEWNPSGENVARLKKHLAQFLTVATGGPAKYEGQDMKAAHAGMRISNAEFDASVGDLKATLDKLQIPTDEQKELLAIVESTRPQVAEER